MKIAMPELLAPAGNMERLTTAIDYGADAVYLGAQSMSLRNYADNFTPEQLTEGVIYAHARGRKVYLTMNTLPTNEEADRLPDAIKDARYYEYGDNKTEQAARAYWEKIKNQ